MRMETLWLLKRIQTL